MSGCEQKAAEAADMLRLAFKCPDYPKPGAWVRAMEDLYDEGYQVEGALGHVAEVDASPLAAFCLAVLETNPRVEAAMMKWGGKLMRSRGEWEAMESARGEPEWLGDEG